MLHTACISLAQKFMLTKFSVLTEVHVFHVTSFYKISSVPAKCAEVISIVTEINDSQTGIKAHWRIKIFLSRCVLHMANVRSESNTLPPIYDRQTGVLWSYVAVLQDRAIGARSNVARDFRCSVPTMYARQRQ
jgi:hypothetical protein